MLFNQVKVCVQLGHSLTIKLAYKLPATNADKLVPIFRHGPYLVSILPSWSLFRQNSSSNAKYHTCNTSLAVDCNTNRTWRIEPWVSIYIATFLKSQRWSLFDTIIIPKGLYFEITWILSGPFRDHFPAGTRVVGTDPPSHQLYLNLNDFLLTQIYYSLIKNNLW